MSLTPNPSRRLGFAVPPSPAPFLTPRPEKRPTDLRWSDSASTANRHDREVNIQVILRCRPLSDDEQRTSGQRVISCNEQKREVTVHQGVLNRQADRTFVFDKVFGPKAQQRSIYDHAILPFVNDALEGFNCTVFAYGQTGTGKTYTMEGGLKSKGVDLPAEAGVIPRAVRCIFDKLEARKADYSMKVSFLELYNEEIADLLALDDHTRSLEERHRRPISLMEDGKGGAVIRGLEEEVVYSENEVYGLLERGAAKRRTADTLLNKHSSRSHSIFSITINVKEAAVGNEELIKCGRLSLVDLAGSENVCRSGAREGRAREAGEMNKSLLTLGRVITALVDHSGHVPYRDSKLTRLLRESLGGKAKTCIIATISPSLHCLEETLSTLDYAYRAKNIKNKPEVNQKLSKSVLLKDLYLEIERMKQDVRAAREKNGVYIPHERFAQEEAEKKAMSERIEKLEYDLSIRRKEADSLSTLYRAQQERNSDLETAIKECKMSQENTERAFLELQRLHIRTEGILKEKDFIISNLLQSEHAITERAKNLHGCLETSLEDRSLLFDAIERKAQTETRNQGLVLKFGSQLDQCLTDLHKTVTGSVCHQHQVLRSMEEHVSSFVASKSEAAKSLELRIEKINDMYSSGVLSMKELATALQNKSSSDLQEMEMSIVTHALAVENFLVAAVSEAGQVLEDVQRSLYDQVELLTFSTQQQEEGLRRCLISTQFITKITIDFFNDIRNRATRFAALLEENQVERSSQLEAFARTFKELSANEEKAALEKIAGILTKLTDTKATMVYKALENLSKVSVEEKKKLNLELSDIQKLSDVTKEEFNGYIKEAECRFQENSFSSSETCSTMQKNFQYCLNRVGQSMQHWSSSQSSINQLNHDYSTEREALIEKINQESDDMAEELVLTLSRAKIDFDRGTNDLLTTVNDSLALDHGASETISSKLSMFLNTLDSLQNNHTKCVTDVRNLSDKCLQKEYQVDHPSGTTPRKQTINLPSLASIEALRTPSFAHIVGEMRMTNISNGEAVGKQTRHHPQSPRNPLTPVN